jgi:hypothetical protein
MVSKVPAQGLFSKLLNFTRTKIKKKKLTGTFFKMNDNYKG